MSCSCRITPFKVVCSVVIAFFSLLFFTNSVFSQGGVEAYPPEVLAPWPDGKTTASGSGEDDGPVGDPADDGGHVDDAGPGDDASDVGGPPDDVDDVGDPDDDPPRPPLGDGGAADDDDKDDDPKCDFYDVQIKDYDDDDVHVIGEDVFYGTGATLACLDQVVSAALDYEDLYEELLEDLDKALRKGEDIGRKRPKSKSDVINLVKVWSQDAPEVEAQHDAWQRFLKEADDDVAEYMEEQILGGDEHGYMDANCRPVRPSGDSCGDIDVRWTTSPISLIWEEGYQLNDISIVSFPLIPGSSAWWYTWKASDKSPLLVYDPRHSGSVRNGTQLFGNYTFGGPASASLSSQPGLRRSSTWSDGYQALSVLDLNDDGKLSGKELAPLALWFDSNRDGHTQQGEIRTLADEQVTELYYQPDRTDSDTGDIHASRGYQRIVDGKKITGASVDWFAEQARSQFELIGRQIAQSRPISSERIGRMVNPQESTSEMVKDDRVAKRKNRVLIDGVWRWKIEHDRKYGVYKPQGILTFKESPIGRIVGHSLVELPLRNKGSIASSFITWLPLHGRTEVLSDGRTRIHFEIVDKKGTKTSTVAILSPNGGVLEGKSETKISSGQGKQSSPTTLRYAWKAVRYLPSSSR